MADYGFNTQLTPQTQQSSLGDMVNLARGVQAYQQAQELNPIQIQQQYQAAQKANLELKNLETANRERDAVLPYLQNTSNYTNEDGLIDMPKATNEIYKLAPQTANLYLKNLQDFATGQLSLAQSKLNLDTNQKNQVGQAIMAVARSADRNNPEAYQKVFDNLTNANKGLQKVTQNYKNMLSKFQPGDHIGDDMLREAQTMLSLPEQESVFGTKVATDSQGRVISTRQVPGQLQPEVSVSTPQGLQYKQETPPQIAPGVSLKYPVRSANQPYVPEPSETADASANLGYRQKLTDAQGNLVTNRRNAEEVFNQANKISQQLYFQKGGIPGEIERKIRMAIGSDQYDLLAKDLANLALSNSAALGGAGNTVAGLDMQAVANGTIKVPPEVLMQIARRVQADQTNIDMQAQGANVAAQKFGDNNLGTFRQQWAKNAQSEIFEAMKLMQTLPPNQLQKAFVTLFPKPEDRALALKKYKNLKSLQQNGVPLEDLK